MAIQVLANRALEFKNEATGETKEIKIGFATLPNWVEKSRMYELAISDGSIQPFEKSKDAEAVENLALQRKLLEDEISELEDKKTALEDKLGEVKSKGDDQVKALKDEIAELTKERNSVKKELKDKEPAK